MKKISYVFLVCLCIFLVSCTSGEKEVQTTEIRENGQKAADNKPEEKAEQEKQQYPEVVDGTGVSRQLKLGEVDTDDVGYTFDFMGFASDYSQVVDGHYYYLRTDGLGNYTVYQDKGKKVVRFTIGEDYYVQYFVKYGEGFYAFVKESDFNYGELNNTLVSIDAKTGDVTKIKDMTVEVAVDESWWPGRAVFYRDSFYFEDYSDYYSPDYHGVREVGRGRLACLHLDERLEKERFPLTSRMESMKEKPILTFIDGKIYYGNQQDRKVTLFSYDLESGEEKEVFCYERTDLEQTTSLIDIKMDEDYIYCQDYMIPREGGKMEQMPQNISSQDLTPNGKYIYYTDGKSRLHRISRKTQKDVVICDDIQVSGFDYTEDGIYVEETNKAWLEREDEESWDDWADPRSNNLYFMDFDGKNRKKIWKEVTEINSEDFD